MRRTDIVECSHFLHRVMRVCRKHAGLDLVHQWLRLLGPRLWWLHALGQPALCSIEATFWVHGVGTVCAGLVSKGRVSVGDTLLIGPLTRPVSTAAATASSFAPFAPVTISSIHYQRVSVDHVHAGQMASFALKRFKRSLVRRRLN